MTNAKRLGGICSLITALALGSVLILGFSQCTRSPKTKAEMAQEFEAEFGLPPSDGVNGYQCTVASAGDTLQTWFSFRCTDQMFEKIHATGYQSKQASDGYSGHLWEDPMIFGEPNAPRWWPGLPKLGPIFWREWHTNDGTGHSQCFWRDPSHGKVYSKYVDWR